MELKSNRVKKILKEGGTCFGTMLSILKSPHGISMCAACGWDYVIIDTEHNDFNIQSLASCSLIAKYEPLTLLVRLPTLQYHQMVQTLDVGAEGLVLPQVKTEKETDQIIKSSKYAPIGERGISVSPVATRYRSYDLLKYMQWANEESLIVVMVESKEGVDNIEKITSVKGVDVIMVGPSDLSQDLGIPGQLEHPQLEKTIGKVIEACTQHGIASGIYVDSMDQAYKWIEKGMRFITYSYDYMFFMKGSQQALEKLNSRVDN